ncbi:MAG TPA: glycosyltransferase family 87 protein [Anaerolineae bacterium]|nr:glycosyltransferase family 87 protein [Anaerolineae bacterium]
MRSRPRLERALVHAADRLRLPREAGLILGVFLAFRLMMLITLRPEPLTFFGDYPYYYELAQLSDRGLWPYLHYWMEYPPIFPFLSTLIYRLTASGGYAAYTLTLSALNVLFGAANLILLMRLATRLHGAERATRLGWVYSALFVPLIFTWWQFETITACCILFALDRLLEGRDVPSAIAAGLGVMLKLVPLLIVPAVALTRPIRKTARYVGIVAGLVLLIAAPLFVAAPDTTRASLASPLAWSSWETVWALIDGNFRTGLLGGIDIHFDNALATTPVGNPSRLPDWLKAIGFGIVYVLILRRMRSASAQSAIGESAIGESATGVASYRTVGILTVTYLVFILWSKGWSPQWQVTLIPLILLMLPNASGIGFVLIFGLINLAEYPVLISRGLWGLVIVTILLRTLLLIVLLIEVVRRCQRMATDGRGQANKRIIGEPTNEPTN